MKPSGDKIEPAVEPGHIVSVQEAVALSAESLPPQLHVAHGGAIVDMNKVLVTALQVLLHLLQWQQLLTRLSSLPMETGYIDLPLLPHQLQPTKPSPLPKSKLNPLLSLTPASAYGLAIFPLPVQVVSNTRRLRLGW